MAIDFWQWHLVLFCGLDNTVDKIRRRVRLAQRAFQEVHGTATDLQRKHRDKSTSLEVASVRSCSH